MGKKEICQVDIFSLVNVIFKVVEFDWTCGVWVPNINYINFSLHLDRWPAACFCRDILLDLKEMYDAFRAWLNKRISTILRCHLDQYYSILFCSKESNFLLTYTTQTIFRCTTSFFHIKWFCPLSLNDHSDSRLGNCPSIRGCFFIPVVRAAFSDDY